MTEVSKTPKITTHDLTLIALFVAIMAVLAQITVPFPLVPLTMQTFAFFLAGIVLGAKRGVIAACIYLLLGAVGVPVFAAFHGGFGIIIGPTGGYLLSFPLVALTVGLAAEKADKATATKGKYLWLVSGLVVGIILNLSIGMLQLALVTRIGLQAAFLSGVFPFLVPELIKATLVLALAPKIRQIVMNENRT